MKPKNIPALTGLRFFAAMVIVLTHSQTGYFFKMGAFAPFYLDGAVPVFFVLSGFILTLGADKYKSWSDFFVARFARIWPTHMAALIFTFAIFYPYSMYFFHYTIWMIRLALNALLLQSWSPIAATYWSYNAPSWSLSCEMFFYAVFPIAVVILSRHTVVRLLALIAVTFSAIFLIANAYPHIDPNWLESVLPLSSLPLFGIGVAAGIFYRRLPATTASFARGTIVQVAALSMALAANVLFSSYPAHIAPAASGFILLGGPSPFYAALILALARYDGAISRALSLRPIVYGGEISYAVYLFHQLFIRAHSGIRADFAGIPNWWQYAGLMAAVLATSIVAHHLVERPAQKTILAAWRMFRQPQAFQPVAADAAD